MFAIPDELLEIIGMNWDRLGMNPVFVLRLLERGFDVEQIMDGMNKLVGEDWLDIKASVWIDRMIAGGSKLMEASLETDYPPVIDVLAFELGKLFREEDEMRMCSSCGRGRWEGRKKDGKFVCKECLEKEREEKKEPKVWQVTELGPGDEDKAIDGGGE